MYGLRNIAMGVRQRDGQTDGKSDPYVSPCFAGDTKSIMILRYMSLIYVTCMIYHDQMRTSYT